MNKNLKTFFLRLCFLFASLMLAPFASAEESAKSVQSLLGDMSNALRVMDYRGTFIYEQNGKMSSYEIVHLVKEGKEFERVRKLDGDQSEIIRQGKSVDCYQPGELILRGRFPKELIKKIGALSDNYSFAIEKEVRVADRVGYLLTIKPMDEFRYGYSFVVDKENYMLLQGSVESSDQGILEKFHFVSLIMGDVDESELKPVTNNYKTALAGECSASDHQAAMPDIPWQMELPKGYMFCIYETDKNISPNALVYSDGLSTFSVFVNDGFELPKGATMDSYREGSTLIYSQHVKLQDRPYTVTVVGEIPEVTAKKISKSLRKK